MPRKWSASRALLPVIAAAVALTVAPAARAADWDGPVRLEAATAIDAPAIAIDDAGNAAAIWTRNRDTGTALVTEVLAAHRPAGGSWSSATTIVEHYVPALSIDGGGGRFVATWRQVDDVGGNLRTRVYAVEFTPEAGWGAPAVLREIAETGVSGDQIYFPSEPQVVVDPQGMATVLIAESEQKGYVHTRSVVDAVRWPAGGTAAAAVPLAEEAGAPPADLSAAVAPDGQVTAAWIVHAASWHPECSMRAATFSAGGWGAVNPFFSNLPSAGNANCADFDFAVAAGGGGATVVWKRNGGIEAARRGSDGIWSGVSVLPADAEFVGASRADDGSTLVVWRPACGYVAGEPEPCPVSAAELPAEGAWGDIGTVAGQSPLASNWRREAPVVTHDGAGGAVVAWMACEIDCALESAERPAGGAWQPSASLPVDHTTMFTGDGNRSGEIAASTLRNDHGAEAFVRTPGAEACPVPALAAARSSATTAAAEMPAGPPQVGNWWFTGCFTKTGEHTYEASQPVQLNGLGVELQGAGKLVVDTQAMTLSATAPVTVTAGPVTVAGHEVGPFTLYQGALNWSLSAEQIAARLPAEAKLLGLGIASSQALLHATAGGEVSIGFDVTLPEILGGGTAQSALTASWVSGLRADSLKVTGASAAIGEVFRLSNLTLDYASGVAWSLTGDVAAGSGLSGRFAYENGSLASGVVDVASVPLGGLAELTDVHLEMAPITGGGRRWSGSAKQDANSLAAAFSYDGAGKLTAASLDASELDLFGALQVKPLKIAYAAGDWSATANAVVPGTDPATADLSVAFDDGLLTEGSLAVARAAVGPARIDDLTLGYAYAPATKETKWDGSARLMLNGPSRSRIDASFAAVNGKLTKLAVAADPIDPALPLGPGVGLVAAGFSYTLAPAKLAGRLAVAAGPVIAGKPAVRADGDMSYLFPSDSPDSDVYDVAATAKLVDVDLAEAHVRYLARSGRTEFSGRLGAPGGWTIGPVRVGATLDGWADRTGFLAKGTGELGVMQYAGASGSIAANRAGIAGCGALKAGWEWKAGFTYAWGGALETFGGACDLGRWIEGGELASAPAGARSATVDTVSVPSGRAVLALRFTGDGGPPNVTLTDPNGVAFATPAEPGVMDTYAVLQDDAATIFLVDSPAAGAWTIDVGAGPALSGHEYADPLPPVDVEASVAGTGATRTLSYSATDVDGQEIAFVEHGGAGERVIATVDGSSGTLDFSPGPGPSGARTVTAEVTQHGFHRATVEVASFEAPAGESLTVDVTGPGRVDSSAGPACSDLCETVVVPGTLVTLTAVADDGFRFAGWEGACTGSAACVVPVDAAAAVTALFEPVPPPPAPPAEPPPASGGDTAPETVAPPVLPPVVIDPPVLRPRGAAPYPRLKGRPRMRRGSILLAAECVSACRLTTRGTRLRIKGKRAIRLRSASKALRRAGRASLRIKLSPKQRRLVRRGGRRVRLQLVLTAYYPDGRTGGPIIKTVRLPR